VANDVTRAGAGFGSDQNAAVLIERDGRMTDLPLKSKRELADDILNAARRWLNRPVSQPPAQHLNRPKRR
jgi:phosphopantothenoylcysteine decarboxylase/phosphopantothenate--cysteine ligase